MMNSRGQAFSVFELMIAAIVAIAILFVLLPIISNIVTPQGEANSTIGSALVKVKSGATVTTAAFQLKQNDTIKSEHFADKGFDSCSIIFDKGKFTDAEITATNNAAENGSCNNFFIYKKTSPTSAKASVVCESTPTSLSKTLEAQGVTPVEDPTTICGDDGALAQCCYVLLQRS